MDTKIVVGILLAVFFLVIVGVILMLIFFGPSSGPKGESGILGSTGVQGIKGYTGYRGMMGDTATAYTGSTGPEGYTGSTGYMGSKGDSGPLGYTGSTGSTGTLYVPYIQAQTPTIYTLTPGFSGATGGVGSTEIIGDWNSIISTNSSYSVIGTEFVPPSGVQEIKIGFSAQSYLDTQNTRINIYAEDAGGILDQTDIIIPPGYLQSFRTYTVPLYIDSTGINFEIKMRNDTIVDVGTNDIVPSDYALRIQEIQTDIQKVSTVPS